MMAARNGRSNRATAAPVPVTRACIDAPEAGAVVSARGFTLSGWVFRDAAARLDEVRAVVDGAVVGTTRLIFTRPDVAASLGFAEETLCGFAFHVASLPLATAAEISVEARFGDETETVARVDVVTSGFDPCAEHYGTLGDPSFDLVLHRHDVYTVGPPSAVADPRCVESILGYAAAGERVIDVGCGIGAYAEPLLEAGRMWHGCEVVPEFVEAMRERGLDVTQASGETLPFADAEFDLAICIEVLEHIDDFETFAGEIARVARRGAMFSVPNVGAIPRYAPLGVVPWHLLEGSHVNFFTASSLKRFLERFFARVEVVEYGRLALDAADGTPVYNHLFAVAMHDVEPM